MSRVIKSGAGTSLVRPLAVKTMPSPRDEERGRLERRCAALESELRQRDQAIDALRKDVAEAYARGKSEGHASGLAEADSKETERFAALRDSLQRAEAGLAASFKSVERLALLVARDCLDKLLCNPDHRQEILGELIKVQAAKLETSALVDVAVSAEDFPAKPELTALAKKIGLAATHVTASRETASGACTMKLRLGIQEVGLHQQWGVLSQALSELVNGVDLL